MDGGGGDGAQAALTLMITAPVSAYLAASPEEGGAAWTAAHARGCVREFVRFMRLKHRHGDGDARMLSPSGDVDTVWHALLLMPRLYARFCGALTGTTGDVFDHVPLVTDARARVARRQVTAALYAAAYPSGH